MCPAKGHPYPSATCKSPPMNASCSMPVLSTGWPASTCSCSPALCLTLASNPSLSTTEHRLETSRGVNPGGAAGVRGYGSVVAGMATPERRPRSGSSAQQGCREREELKGVGVYAQQSKPDKTRKVTSSPCHLDILACINDQWRNTVPKMVQTWARSQLVICTMGFPMLCECFANCWEWVLSTVRASFVAYKTMRNPSPYTRNVGYVVAVVSFAVKR